MAKTLKKTIVKPVRNKAADNFFEFVGLRGDKPKDAPPPVTADDEEVRKKKEEERRALAARKGLRSTRLTGARGLLSEDDENVKRKRLMPG